MTTVADFIKIQKSDSCKHLHTGMRYASFVRWSGFLVPGFSDTERLNAGSASDLALRSEVERFIQMRIDSAHDLSLLLSYALTESNSENVTACNGTVNIDFVSKCKNSTEFLDAISAVSEKYADKIAFRPFLGIDSDKENNLALANMLLESKLFSGIELYGTRFASTPEKYLMIFNTVHELNLDSRVCCFGFRELPDRDSIFELMLNLRPNLLLNPNIAINNDNLRIFKDLKIFPEVIAFIKDNNIHIEFSPAPILSGKKGEQKAQVIREFAENDIPFSLATEDTLYLNKSLSEFASDLCNAGVFSKDELVGIISSTPSKA